MKTMLRLFLMLATVATLVAQLGCSSSGGASEADKAPAETAAAEKTLFDQLGGESGVTQFANQFGTNLQANPDLAALLTPEAIENAKAGLTNDIKKASNMDGGGMTLESALKDQGLKDTTLAGVNNAIVQAAKTMNLNQATTDSLTDLIKPLARSVLEAK